MGVKGEIQRHGFTFFVATTISPMTRELATKKREAVSLDLSLYTHPVQKRSIRCPLLHLCKNTSWQVISRAIIAAEKYRLFLLCPSANSRRRAFSGGYPRYAAERKKSHTTGRKSFHVDT